MVGTLFPDDFSLGVSTNYVFNLTENGTSGNLEVNFDVLSSIPEDLILSLGSENEVRQYLFQNGYTSAKGQGSWVTSITCNDAPSIVPELFNEGFSDFNIAQAVENWLEDYEEFSTLKDRLRGTEALLRGEMEDVAPYLEGLLRESYVNNG